MRLVHNHICMRKECNGKIPISWLAEEKKPSSRSKKEKDQKIPTRNNMQERQCLNRKPKPRPCIEKKCKPVHCTPKCHTLPCPSHTIQQKTAAQFNPSLRVVCIRKFVACIKTRVSSEVYIGATDALNPSSTMKILPAQ